MIYQKMKDLPKSECLERTESVPVKSCPGCNSNDHKKLEEMYKYSIYVTDAEEIDVSIGVSGCRQCGLIFINPKMSEKALYNYYENQSRIPHGLDKNSTYYALVQKQLDLIETIKPITSGIRILEIGSAEAVFLQCAQLRCNSKIDAHGVELSKKYNQQARLNMPSATIYESPLEATNFNNQKFDIIVLRHVFEHLSSPLEALRIIRSIISPDGVLYIEIPDTENTKPSVSKFFHHEHLLYFTKKTLKNHLGMNGFKTQILQRYDGNPIGSGFDYPVIRSISVRAEPETDAILPEYSAEIYQRCKKEQEEYNHTLLSSVREKLSKVRDAGGAIGIFGAGPHTMDLLGQLENDNVEFEIIFDNNPNKQGRSMRGIPITVPNSMELKKVNCILISSAQFEDEMCTQIDSLVGASVEIIRIYRQNDEC
jgi:2-polyprenyl-3-methyl-5-hydroxy-6-metoxy-1,4-benzoquinol methylase